MRHFISLLFLAISVCTTSYAQTESWKAIVDEDFSLFDRGTEETPDSVSYSKETSSGNYYIDDPIFHQSGWSGGGIYMAGGCASLSSALYGGGYINTPEGVYTGRIRVSFRYKAVPSATNSQIIYYAVCTNGIVSPLDPGTGVVMVNAEAGADWATATHEFINPSIAKDCFVQINAAMYQKGVLIDDVKVERDENYLSTPTGLSHTNYSLDGFTATWKPVAYADSYLVTVEKETSTSSEMVEYTEGFENLIGEDGVVTDASQETGIATSGENIQLITDGVPEGSKAIGLNDDSQSFEIVGNGGLIKKMTFQIAITSTPTGSVLGSFYIDGWDGNEWTSGVASFRMNGSTIGKWETIDTEEEDEGYIAWSGEKKFEDRYTKFRFHVATSEGMTFAFDDFHITSAAPSVIEKVVDDQKVEGSSLSYDEIVDAPAVTFDVADFDPYSDYYVTVKACKGDVVTEASSRYRVFDITVPVAREATNVDERGAFTANWEPTPKATAYTLRVTRKYIVPEDTPDFVIFDEDFSKAEASASGDYDYWYNWSAYSSLDEVSDNTGWLGSGTIVGDGMVGCQEGYSAYDMLWDMTSPSMSLNNNGGKFYVTITAEAPSTDDCLVVQSQGDYVFVDLPAGKTVTTTVSMENGQRYDDLYFWTYNNGPFLLDRVTVTQDLKKDDEVYSVYDTVDLDASENSYRVTGLDIEDNYKFGYALTATRKLGSKSATSDYSNDITVDALYDGIHSIQDNALEEGDAEYYNLNGQRMNGLSRGVNIIKKGDKIRKVNLR